jgi:hypothetical protein
MVLSKLIYDILALHDVKLAIARVRREEATVESKILKNAEA